MFQRCQQLALSKCNRLQVASPLIKGKHSLTDNGRLHQGWRGLRTACMHGTAGTPMTKEEAARIMSEESRRHGGQVPKGSYAARAQSAADKNIAEGVVPQWQQLQEELEDDELLFHEDEAPTGAHMNKVYMTKEAAARIMSAEARTRGGQVEKGSFAARAQSAADRNMHKGLVDR